MRQSVGKPPRTRLMTDSARLSISVAELGAADFLEGLKTRRVSFGCLDLAQERQGALNIMRGLHLATLG